MPGLRGRTGDIDLLNPINTQHPLNNGLVGWYWFGRNAIGNNIPSLATSKKGMLGSLRYYDNANFSNSYSGTGFCTLKGFGKSAAVQTDPRGYLRTPTNQSAISTAATFSGWIGTYREWSAYRNLWLVETYNWQLGLSYSGNVNAYISLVAYGYTQGAVINVRSNRVRPLFLTGTFAEDGNCALYVNGQLAGTGFMIGQQNQTTQGTGAPLVVLRYSDRVAGQQDWYGPYFAQHIGVWNRALNRVEVATLYKEAVNEWPTFLNKIPATKKYSFLAGVKPTTFTASASLTTGATSASGSATHTPPTYTGTSTVTTAAATCSGSATSTAPTYTATASVTIAAASCSASGTFVTPVNTGTSVVTVGAATASGAATFTVPVYTASAAVAVGATVVNVAGSVVVPTYTAAAAVSVGAAVASGVASNNFVAGPYRVAARQVFVPGAVAFQVRTTGASAAQVF